MIIKYIQQPMLKALRELQAYCELIIYTYLPKELCDSFISKVPEIRNIFSYIFNGNDILEAEEGSLLIKDMTLLL